MAFVVPCISIVVCYARIFYIVRKTAMRSHESGPSLSHASLQMHPHSRESRKEVSTNNNKSSSVDGTETQMLSLNSRRESDGGVRSKSSNRNNRLRAESDDQFDHSSSLSHSHSHMELKSSLKLCDLNAENEGMSVALKRTQELRALAATDRNLSNVSICKTVEFIDSNGKGDRDCTVRIEHDVDSAVEESTSSTDNNQVRTVKYEHSIISLKISRELPHLMNNP